MSTEVKLSLIGDFTTLTGSARLDGLCANQNPSTSLVPCGSEHEPCEEYPTFLVGDAERTEALLEVFDKVRQKVCAIP